MKRFFAVVCCFACAPLCALSLDGESKREAKLFNSFLSSVYALRSNDAKAFSKLQKTLALQPDSKYLKRLLVSAAVADNRPDLAAEYADFISSGENTADDWSVYGAYLWKKGDLAAAREAYQQALKQSDDLRIMFQYVTLLSGLAPAQAAAALEELAAGEPDFASPIYTEIGNLFLQRGDLNLALGYFNKAVDAAPFDPAPRLGRGEVYEKASQYFLMLHEFEELEKMGFGNAATYSRMGSVFLLVKDYPKAEEYFLKAKADDNGDVPSAYFLSLLAEQKEDYARAAGYLKEAADYPTSASKWLQVSFYQNKLNRPEESLKTLEEAYKKFGGNVEIGFFYALALNDAGEYKKAARVLKGVLRTNPNYTEARLQYAFTLESLKKYKEMEIALQTVLEEQPENAAALNLYAYSLAVRGERLDLAQEYIARALAVNPEDNSFIDTQAWIYFKQGKIAEAADLLDALPDELAERDADAAYHKGAVAYERGEWEKARKYLELSRRKNKEAAQLYKRLPPR